MYWLSDVALLFQGSLLLVKADSDLSKEGLEDTSWERV